MQATDRTARMASGQGFIAALDQSGGSTPKALAAYGIDATAYRNDEEMFALIHAMRARIITAPAFNGDMILGAILFERTMDGAIDGKPVPSLLIEREVLPFIKIDKGLESEACGVQLMKPMPDLDILLPRAKGLGVYGSKARSVVQRADRAGIAAIVAQQMAVARQVLALGLMPILEPEVNIISPDRAQSDRILLQELQKALDAMPGDDRLMLKLSIPAQAGLFDPLIDHPRVLRVVALSGGYSRAEACAELACNRGMIASFSRALLEGLRYQMDDAQFNSALANAIDEIYAASTHKVAQ